MATKTESAPPPGAAPRPGGDGDASYVVALGASAGGLEALDAFFEHMPADSGLAFVVVQHLSPDYKSLMVELLSRRTTMEVLRVQDGMPVEPNRIYLIPPKKNMIMFHGKLLLTEQERGHTVNLPIDIFMRSLAEDRGEKAIGVILSGTGSDGMRGVRAIKEAGGMVMAQDESSAKFDGMPRSAISTGLVDFTLAPEEMPEQLLSYVQHPYATSGQGEAAQLLADEDSLTKVLALVQRASGVDFTYYKPSTVVRRVERRMNINQLWHLSDYVKYLESTPREVLNLNKELLIGVTSFFRDPQAYEVVANSVVPAVLERHRQDGAVRVWSAGCSTGEEAYSLAILLLEQADRERLACDVKVFATDLDREALDFAGQGLYPESIAADVSPERLGRFFVRRGGSYQVARRVREAVIFAKHNLLRDPPFTKIDLLSCRNLLIYLQPETQKRVLSFFDFSLNPGGHLFLGSSETVGDLSAQFKLLDAKHKIYRSQGTTRKLLPDGLLSAPGRRIRQLTATIGGMRGGGDENRPNETMYQALIEEYVPPSFAVDENYEIVHVFRDISRYVRFPVGKVTGSVLKTARADLAPAVGTALHRANKDSREVVYRNIALNDDDGTHTVHLRVRPVDDRRSQRRLFLIFLEEDGGSPARSDAAEIVDSDASQRERISDLERELQFTRENLQATIEELETSNEELQATNEELVSANEELQSTNEELQSVNEELYTVNAEYQSKIHELTVLNNDMDNLLRSTGFATVFLDENLMIRKFTGPIQPLLNVMDQDVGRPLEHISTRLEYTGFLPDIRQVLRTRVAVEREVRARNGEWALVNITPYRQDDRPTGAGVVVTFVNITHHKEVEEQLRQERDTLARIMDSTASAILVVAADGRIVRANARAETIFGLPRTEILARRFDDPAWQLRTATGKKVRKADLPVQQVLKTGQPVEGVRYAAARADGRRVQLSANAGPLVDETGSLTAVLLSLSEIPPADPAEASGTA